MARHSCSVCTLSITRVSRYTPTCTAIKGYTGFDANVPATAFGPRKLTMTSCLHGYNRLPVLQLQGDTEGPACTQRSWLARLTAFAAATTCAAGLQRRCY